MAGALIREETKGKTEEEAGVMRPQPCMPGLQKLEGQERILPWSLLGGAPFCGLLAFRTVRGCISTIVIIRFVVFGYGSPGKVKHTCRGCGKRSSAPQGKTTLQNRDPGHVAAAGPAAEHHGWEEQHQGSV